MKTFAHSNKSRKIHFTFTFSLITFLRECFPKGKRIFYTHIELLLKKFCDQTFATINGLEQVVKIVVPFCLGVSVQLSLASQWPVSPLILFFGGFLDTVRQNSKRRKL
jgi:hypothetical protein